MQAIGVLAAEIVMSLAVDLRQGIWIDICTTKTNESGTESAGIGRLRLAKIGNRLIEGNMLCARRQRTETEQSIVEIFHPERNRVGKDIIIFKRAIAEVIAAYDEIERARQVRCEAHFLIELMRVF